jgi:hypothetical protein
MPPRNPGTGRTTSGRDPRKRIECPPELDAEDEAALDRAWDRIAREDAARDAKRDRRQQPGENGPPESPQP